MFEEKLVIIAYLTPQDSIRVLVSRSIPFGTPFDEKKADVPNATLSIRDGSGHSQNLSLSSSSRSVYVCSQKEFPIVPGERYFLNGSAPNLPSISASTIVPKEMASWKTASISQTNDGISEFNGTWASVQNEHDIDYGVFVYRAAEPQDILFGNESISPINGGYSVQKQFYLGRDVKAVLVTRTKALGEFSKMTQLTLDMKDYYSSAGFYDLISGFKGVIPEYNNIDNGLGIFGGYLLEEKSMN